MKSTTVNPIVKGSIVLYTRQENGREVQGWMRVTALFKDHVNLGPIFGGRGRWSGIVKNVPFSQIVEDEETWTKYWVNSETYRCM